MNLQFTHRPLSDGSLPPPAGGAPPSPGAPNQVVQAMWLGVMPALVSPRRMAGLLGSLRPAAERRGLRGGALFDGETLLCLVQGERRALAATWDELLQAVVGAHWRVIEPCAAARELAADLDPRPLTGWRTAVLETDRLRELLVEVATGRAGFFEACARLG